jgi:hypothetical protein
MFMSSGRRRIPRALPALVALAAALPVAGAEAAAAGPSVTVRVEGVESTLSTPYRSINDPAHAVVLGTASDTPVAVPSDVDCGLGSGLAPANSVAAAVKATDASWAMDAYGFPATLTLFGASYGIYGAAFISDPTAPDPTVWSAWVNNHYHNLYQFTSFFCRALEDGDEVLLQGSVQRLPDGGSSMFGLPVTPKLELEDLPVTVAKGVPFDVKVAKRAPADWGGAEGDGVRADAVGYTVDAAGGAVTTGPGGTATLTINGGGYYAVSAYHPEAYGDANSAFPTPSGNSARTVASRICVFDESVPSSPCVGNLLSVSSTPFGTQARDTIGPPRTITLSSELGHVGVTSVKVVGAGPEQDGVDDFQVSHDGCSGQSVSGTAVTCVIRVRFAPTSIGARAATLRIANDGGTGALDVPLAGAGGAPSAGPAGQDGEKGDKGDAGGAGAAGANGAPGPAGAGGPAGPAGATGPAGTTGPQGKSGRDARCTVKRTKGAPKVTCKLVATKSASKATLTRNGRVYARGTLTALRATRKVGAGAYTLRYRSAAGKAIALRVRIG